MKTILEQIQRAPSCAGLISGGIFDCLNPPVPGIKKRVIIGSIQKIASKSFDVSNDLLLEDIVMLQGEQCYQFDGAKNSIVPQIELREGSLSNTFAHMLALSIFELDSDQKMNIQGMSFDQLFCIIENANDSSLGDSIFEVYGLGGMEVNELTRNPTDQDTGGAYVMNMQTPEEYGGETQLPVSLDAGGYQATLDLIDVLLAPAV